MNARLERESPAPSPAVILLSRRDVAALMDSAAWLEAVEAGFRAVAGDRAHAPTPMAIEGNGGAFHAKGARIDLDRRYVALKLNGNFPGNPERVGLPTIQGAILLCDGETGALLAVMDSIEVTLGRTAAASALAARYLARPASETILICGCGEQAGSQLAALRAVLPLRHAFAWDRDPDRAHHFSDAHCTPAVSIKVVTDLASAALASDVIVTCTTASEPFLDAAMVAPGTFIAAVGADSPGKSEIAPELMARALVVTDALDQCVAMGDLRNAMTAGTMDRGDVHAGLADLVTGNRPGRTTKEQITLFDSTGTALQDVASAVALLRRAIAHGRYSSIDLGSLA